MAGSDEGIFVGEHADEGSPILPAIAGVLALVGMFAYEDSFVRAGQSVPLS